MSFLTDTQKQPDSTHAINEMLVRVDQLAVLPHVVFKVLELSGSEDSAAGDMERAITVDPGFSARLLTLANSSYYGLGRKVTSIRDAIMYLGFKQVREMAMMVGVFDMFIGKNDKESLRRRTWWRHSLDCAVCCRWLAETTKKVNPDEAYTSGLFHFIGKTLLDRYGQADYSLVEQRMAVGTAVRVAELRTFGCDHQELAIEAGKKWGLPPNVIAGFNYLDEPGQVYEFSVHRACVALGDAIATLAVDGPSASVNKLPAWALDVLEIPRESAEYVLEGAIAVIASSANLQF